MNFSTKELYDITGATTKHQKLGVSALVMGILTEPMNKTGFTWDKLDDLERAVYGNSNLTTRIATLAAIGSCNDLIAAVSMELPAISYKGLFEFLNGKTIIPGVSYNC